MKKAREELDTTIKGIVESFNEAQKAAKEFAATTENIFNEVSTNLCMYQVAKVTRLILKREKAPWITRRYWERRFNKEYARLISIAKAAEEYKK